MPADPHARGPRVSVVICAYTDDRRGLLWQNLAAVHRQSRSVDEVVVVLDNNDALAAAVRAEWPTVHVVAYTGPRGLSPARNAGVDAATGDVLVFLDDDAVPERDCVERLLAPFADDAVAGVGGQAVPVWPHDTRPTWLPCEFDWVVGCSYRGQPEQRAQVRNLIGSVMALRREVVVRTGGFRSTVGRVGNDAAGCEETEMCIRFAQLEPSARFLLEPSAVVRHHVGVDRVAFRYFWRRCRAEGRSKAALTGLLGRQPALSAERDYVRRTLPRGVATYLAEAARGDLTGVARAASLVVGLWATGSSYLGARRRASRSAAQDQPTLVTVA